MTDGPAAGKENRSEAGGTETDRSKDLGEPGGTNDPDDVERNASGSSEERKDDGSNGDERSDEDRNADERDREPERSGRALLGVVFVGAVSLAGGFGYFIGSIGPSALGSVGLFGVTVFEPTPIGMALYGMTVTGLVLGVLYVGARIAVRKEERPSDPQ